MNIQYVRSPGKTRAIVRDNSTGVVLNEYEEIVESKMTRAGASPRGSVIVQLTETYNPTNLSNTKLTIFTKIQVYEEVIAGKKVRSITKVHSVDHYLASSGYMKLVNKNTSVKKYDLKYVEINFSGTQETDSTKSGAVSATFNILKKAQFTMSGSAEKTWTARKPYNDVLRVYV